METKTFLIKDSHHMELPRKSSECNKTEKIFNSRLDKHWENQDIQSTYSNFETNFISKYS